MAAAGPLVRRLAALLLLSDANFAQAIAARERGERDAGTLFGSGVAMWIVWVVSTGVGVLAGRCSVICRALVSTP